MVVGYTVLLQVQYQSNEFENKKWVCNQLADTSAAKLHKSECSHIASRGQKNTNWKLLTQSKYQKMGIQP
jgi:hypothetical protein